MKNKVKTLSIRISIADETRINEIADKLKMTKTEAILFATSQLHERVTRK